MSQPIKLRLRKLEATMVPARPSMSHVIMAVDKTDRDAQFAELRASGRLGPNDPVLCITGIPGSMNFHA